MINKPLNIGIDYDLSVVNTVFCANGWFDYLNNMSHCKLSIEFFNSLPEIDYNIGKYWPDLTEDEVMSFWSDPKLYQKLTPNPDAVKVINELAAQGHNIIFLSMCKKGHFASKVQSSKEWFNIPPEQYGFLVTHEKHFADVDIIIDDRNRFLEAFKNKPEVIKIKIKTPYSQDVDLSVSLDLETNDWNKIGEFINDLGE